MATGAVGRVQEPIVEPVRGAEALRVWLATERDVQQDRPRAGRRQLYCAHPQTDLGPMVWEEAARRVEGWVQDAVASGARLFRGRERS